jgi:VanZ family protein
MNLRSFWRGVFALLIVFVTWQTLTPDPDETESGMALARYLAEMLFNSPEHADKVGHFLAYSALGGTAGLGGLKLRGRRRFSVLGLTLYGMVLEYLQGLGGVRDAELLDAFANASGALAGFAGAYVIERFHARGGAR